MLDYTFQPAGTNTPSEETTKKKILGISICLWFPLDTCPFRHQQFTSEEAGVQTYLHNVCIVKCQLLRQINIATICWLHGVIITTTVVLLPSKREEFGIYEDYCTDLVSQKLETHYHPISLWPLFICSFNEEVAHLVKTPHICQFLYTFEDKITVLIIF